VTKQWRRLARWSSYRRMEHWTASTLRLVRGAIKKDFRDRFEVESALFDFLVCLTSDGHIKARDKLRRRPAPVGRSQVAHRRQLAKAIDVEAVAAEYGMSRSHF